MMIYVILSLIVGCIVGFPLTQYAWIALKKISDREEDFSFDKNLKIFGKENLIISATHGVLWAITTVCLGFSISTILLLLTISILITLSIVDWISYEIPPEFNVAIAVLSVLNLMLNLKTWYVYVIGAFLVSGLFLIIALASKGKAMGGGDIKLMFALGLLLGWKKILLVMFLGSVIGATVHTIIMKVSKNKDHMLSFGPYLAVGAYITILCGTQLIDLYIKLCIPEF